MLFSSFNFFIFFSIFLFLIKFFNKYQRYIIIIFSLFFYSYFNINFFPLILFYCFITYFFLKKKFSIVFSILILLLPLFYFKYSFFIFNNLNLVFLIKFTYQGDLPLAISFITFTAITVLVDRKDKDNSDYSFFKILEYILFFPQLIAGPILRLEQLFPQLQKKIFFQKSNIKLGIILFIIGYIKKVYFADNISLLIDPVFQEPSLSSYQEIIKAFLLFPIQIYFDFSGYIDMAMGISIFLGIKLPKNFDGPYLASSVSEFWKKWHITLSNWFRDYLYIPMGGSRNGKLKMYFNLLITMSVAGLWHGASLNFIIWGFLNGFILIFEKFFNLDNLKYSIIRNILVCFVVFNLWVFFRISDFGDILDFFSILYTFKVHQIFNWDIIVTLIFVIFIVLFQKFENEENIKKFSNSISLLFLLPLFFFILSIGFLLSSGQSQKFIYFQF